MKKFKDLTKKGQKMRIVRDAIAQIKINKFVPTEGAYLSVWRADDESGMVSSVHLKNKDNLQKVLKEEDVECDCCAKGALFASCVMSVNKVYGKNDFAKEVFQSKKLSKWFSKGELDMVETAFEKEIMCDTENILRDNDGELTDLGEKCVVFGESYDTATERLLAILENILQNGTFKPQLCTEKSTAI